MKELQALPRTAQVLADELRIMIAEGHLKDGDRITERTFANAFSVSRIPLREAIQILAQEGLLEVRPNRGAIVKMLSEEEIQEIYHLRRLLEGDALARSVPMLTEADLIRAETADRLLLIESEDRARTRLNHEFHDVLFSRCGPGMQLKLVSELRAQVERYEWLQSQILENTEGFAKEHARILNACKVRDSELARTEHVAHLQTAEALALNAVRARAGDSEDRSQEPAG